ncbi:class I SAM-dependent methyltransferase [Ammoniphilus sp. CFH 90114]|uniref:class I SAM-dependent methyltransferase n=1 Tax=Ammoniphilus sp. CFH 90114 TaxID=2493665 RepID=UPI00100E338A|nr:class I SAM-dependent methyltransferase [Ammoniphilus sp. CFH 90114]RXT04134.1 class I SAM-dependent methyltransferase [Ammoniphilus sp. CFH 90114]
MKEWFEKSFQEDYLKIYAHRDEQKATQELEKLIPYLHIKPGQTALDLCCGQGRHSRWLAQLGLRVIGVDLSAVLLQEAIRQSLNIPVLYMRADAREIPFSEEMDLVFNLFTSFGYFLEDSENEKILQQASKALKPGGFFLFDYLNPEHLRTHLVPTSESEQAGMKILQRRTINEEFVQKQIIIQEAGESTRHYEERVKLYSATQLEEMLTRQGFEILHLFGDYQATPYNNYDSARIIFICQKGRK